MRFRYAPLAILSLTALLAACSSAPAPREQMAVSQRAVEAAAASPVTVEAAPVELQQARDKYQRAQRAMDNKDYDEARRLAEAAEVDARLATAKASATRGERAVNELQASLRQLREEIERNRQPR